LNIEHRAVTLPPTPSPTTRRGYLDWARGLAVLIMIQAHLLDSWTRFDARASWTFDWAMIVAGFGAPMFLSLAGTSVALSAGSKWRRSGDVRAAARAVMRRGVWIFFLAFVFRVQAWILGWGAPRTLLKVDILNIMGPSIVAAAAVWGAFTSTRARCIAWGVTALGIAFLTPIVQSTPIFDALPNPIEAYLRAMPGLSNFFLFPWSGFVFAGAIVGALLDQARTPEEEFRLNGWLFAAGGCLSVAAFAASFLPTLYAGSEFWSTSPAYFLLRTGILILLIPTAYVWQKVVIRSSWSPIQQLGRTSLFIYWIHVEMVYGLMSLRIHKTLTHPQAWVAYVLFTVFMLACSLAKDRVVRWKREKGKGEREKGEGKTGKGEAIGSSRRVAEELPSSRLPSPGARVSVTTIARG
jgi:uncharacterized membrane protein